MRRVLQLGPHLVTLASTTSSLVFSLLCCPFDTNTWAGEGAGGVFSRRVVLNVAGSQVVFRFTQPGGFGPVQEADCRIMTSSFSRSFYGFMGV